MAGMAQFAVCMELFVAGTAQFAVCMELFVEGAMIRHGAKCSLIVAVRHWREISSEILQQIISDLNYWVQ